MNQQESQSAQREALTLIWFDADSLVTTRNRKPKALALWHPERSEGAPLGHEAFYWT